MSIAGNNQFGYFDAPRYGTGEILLQARGINSEISIGTRNVLSNNVSLIATTRITIGAECLIGNGVNIFDTDFHNIDPLRRRASPAGSAEIRVGNNVWLGTNVTILKGVEIGDNSVIGAMSLVNRPVPANSLAAGVPARVVRRL